MRNKMVIYPELKKIAAPPVVPVDQDLWVVSSRLLPFLWKASEMGFDEMLNRVQTKG